MNRSDPAPAATWTPRDRRATAAVAIQFAVNGAFFASLIPRLPELRDELDIGTEQVGMLLTVAAASGVLASVTCSRVISRYGTRLVLFAGGLVIALALVGVGVATAWPAALVALAVMFAVDVYVDVAMNMQASWLSARRARPMMNRVHGLWSLGSAGGGLVAGALAGSAVSLQTHLVAAAGLLVVISSLVATQVLPVDEVHVEKAAPDEAPGRRITPRGLMVRLFIAGLAAVTIEVASMNWAAFRITDDLGGASSTGALAFAAVMAGGTIIRFAGDHLSHILGDARFTAGSAALAMVGLVAAAVVDVPALVVGSFLLAGMGIATLTPRLYDMGARAGSGTAAGLGWLTAGMRIATMATPAAVAALATRTSVGVAIAAAGVAAGVLFLAATANIITDQRRA